MRIEAIRGAAVAENLAPPQRVWMAVYPPEQERRLFAFHLQEFKTATQESGHGWALMISRTRRHWMAAHRSREAYFDEDPELLETAMPAFFDHLVPGRAENNCPGTRSPTLS